VRATAAPPREKDGDVPLKAEDFDFALPDELIAQEPAPRRRDARLLHLPRSGAPRHLGFADLPELLRSGDLLVLNETRVLPARLRLRRESGGAVEAFLVRPSTDGEWLAMLRPSRRLSVGETLEGEGGGFALEIRALGDAPRVAFLGGDAAAILDAHGDVPLPPYIHRPTTAADRERYQTVFARVPGAVAAPTAGLHFDEALLADLAGRGVEVARLVLHVGPGTFRPLPDDADLATHGLDFERYEVPASSAARLLEARGAGRRIVAVGTTVVRSLESWALAGSPAAGIAGETDLFVRPPFPFRVVDALVTNFHLPKSSLLCLVSAFVGRERILAVYGEAVRERYRFYSYGDATFLERSS
jgi:S-adenosylmethionine:tRNA ribosyltransferase-isomerase